MPIFKDKTFFTHSSSNAFDQHHSPGTPAPSAGIYRCVACGAEIGIAEGKTLPTQHSKLHDDDDPIEWQLVAKAKH